MLLRVLAGGHPGTALRRVDLEIDASAPPTVAEVLTVLGLASATATIDGRTICPETPALDVIADGSQIGVRGEPPADARAAGAIAVVGGPDAGRITEWRAGTALVGRARSADVVVVDPTVSRRHLEIGRDATGAGVTVCDVGSRNGVRAEGEWVTTARLLPANTLVHLGSSSLRITRPTHGSPTPSGEIRNGRIALVRPPRRRLPDAPVVTPPPPMGRAARRDTLELATIVVPIALAVMMAVAFDPRFALLGLAGPVVTLATHSMRRRRARRDRARHERSTRAALSRFRHDLAEARAAHLHRLRLAVPDLGEIVARLEHDHTRLWERRVGDNDFLVLSAGTGTIEWEPLSREHQRDLEDAWRVVADEYHTIDDAPIVIDARMPLGICGDDAAAPALMRALVLQAAALHGPADLRIVVVTTEDRRDEWEWTEWLPHTDDPRAPTRLVAGGDAAVRDLVEQLLAAGDDDEVHTWVVVDDATLLANRTMPVRQLLRERSRASVAVIGRHAAPLPSLCHTVIEVARDLTVTVAQPSRSTCVVDVRGAGVRRETATAAAARLARFTDPETADGAAQLPASVSLHRLLAPPSGDLSIGSRWAESRRAHSFVVPIGADRDGPLMIDLVHDGPHVLVAGTTGAGKSELLRTLVTSLAATVDARRVNFLLVDYKGGSAFDRCGALPHTVGVVTDLDARLTARALACLDAELRRREQMLRDAGVDDLAAYHRLVDEQAPLPRLVIVVDEFAALLSELPRFVDALIDVGQRGRSLGVHIVLATQRPSGVVNDALRANTNLRISLRVLDQHDSRDVIGVPDAAAISRHQPGRAIARVGAAEIVTFQTASVSGHLRRTTARRVRIVEAEPVAPLDQYEPVCDLAQLLEAITDAHRRAGFGAPRRPWPDPLPDRITLDELDRADAEGGGDDGPASPTVAFGLADVPHEQRRVTAKWHPSIGPLLVHSLRGGGATTALATIAIDLARRHPPERVHLYVIDLGAGDLAPLADLPHCGAYVTATETERQARLLGWITAEIRTRSELPPRERQARPTVVVLVDNLAALGGAPDADVSRDALRRLVSDGAAVDVHLVASTDRAGALGHATDALVAQRVVLRLADPADYSMVGVRGIDPTDLPPGRGFAVPRARELQVALPHHRDLRAAVDAVVAKGGRRAAPPIAVLPTIIACDASTTTDGAKGWIIGMLDRTLGPARLELAPGDHALIAGPARSGKSNALALVALAAEHSGAVVHVVAPPRSPLAGGGGAGAFVPLRDLEALVDALIGAIDDAADDAPRHVIVVDDADSIDDGGHLERLLVARPPHVHVVAGARADRLRATYRHWTAEVRRSRIGVLLRAEEIDGELLGIRLARGRTPPHVAGRGHLVTDHGVEVVQLAWYDGFDDRRAPR